MVIKILGGGCPKCEKLEKLAKEALTDLNIEAQVIKVKNMQDILQYDILETPALVLDEVVKSSGRIPAKEEIMNWLEGIG